MRVRLKYEDAEEELKNVAEIIYKLHYHTKKYNETPTYENRKRVNMWELKADQWCKRVIKEDLS